MRVDFGVVKKYFPEKGFGFITRTFHTDPKPAVFFHIKNIKKSRAELAETLASQEKVPATHFWYEWKETAKGAEVCAVLDGEHIRGSAIDNLSVVIAKIEQAWRDIRCESPVWLRNATVDLVGSERLNELLAEREGLVSERDRLELEHRQERLAEQQAAQAVAQAKIEAAIVQRQLEEDEFRELVSEMAPLGFTRSDQVSRYIVMNRLGYKYQNISGIVMMEQNGTVWDFKGGFPPKVYRKLCEELGLGNKETRARAVSFESFRDIHNKGQR